MNALDELHSFQAQQLQRFQQRGFPTRKEERWKYTDVALFEKKWKENSLGSVDNLQKCHPERSEGSFQSTECQKKILRCAQDDISVESHDEFRLVFVNGCFSSTLSKVDGMPEGIVFCTLQHALQNHKEQSQFYLMQSFDVMNYPFSCLNAASISGGVLLVVDDNVKCDKPLRVIYINTTQDTLNSPRNIIKVGANSSVTFIEEYQGTHFYCTNSVTQIDVLKNAKLHYCKIQQESPTAIHFGALHVKQAQESFFNSFSFSKGSELNREDVQIHADASGTISHLQGLYHLTQANQHTDHHLQVDHKAAHGTSKMFYKGILQGKSQAVFNGKVHVEQAAKQIHAQQFNHNLLLSSDAQVNTKPELEIYADDVKCTHGATVGQLDSDALFYLQSRGIPEHQAIEILTQAFAQEMIDLIESSVIKNAVLSAWVSDPANDQASVLESEIAVLQNKQDDQTSADLFSQAEQNSQVGANL